MKFNNTKFFSVLYGFMAGIILMNSYSYFTNNYIIFGVINLVIGIFLLVFGSTTNKDSMFGSRRPQKNSIILQVWSNLIDDALHKQLDKFKHIAVYNDAKTALSILNEINLIPWRIESITPGSITIEFLNRTSKNSRILFPSPMSPCS